MRCYIRESFCTRHMLTLVWLLAGMSPNVNFESTFLNEALATCWSHAGVWALIDVYAIVPLKVRPAIEPLEHYISRLFRST